MTAATLNDAAVRASCYVRDTVLAARAFNAAMNVSRISSNSA